MSSVITPNMNLTVPGIGTEGSPQYAFEINNDLSTIDQHNHTSGLGVQITPSGLNINTDLPFNSNSANSLFSIRFNSLAMTLSNATPNIACVYVSGNELYYNDYSGGHVIKITNNGSVNSGAGSIGGLPSGTASVNFSGSTYIFQSASTVPATVDVGSVILRNTIASSFGVTLQPISGLPSNYSLTLPTLPSSPAVLTIDTSGNITSNSDAFLALTPTGSVLAYAGMSAPTGWFTCNGQAVNRTTYSTLFGIIGTTYGIGDGSTTFNVPNLINSAPFGIGSRFSIGQTGGSLDPSFNTMVSHNHNYSDPGHSHSSTIVNFLGQSSVPSGVAVGSGSAYQIATFNPTNPSVTGINFNAQGNSTANGNMPPFLGMNYIIKY